MARGHKSLHGSENIFRTAPVCARDDYWTLGEYLLLLHYSQQFNANLWQPCKA